MSCEGSRSLRAGVVQEERTGARLLEYALAHEVREHPVEDIGITAGRGGEVADPVFARGDVVGDPQGRHDVKAPGSAEIAQRFEICDDLMGHTNPPPYVIVSRTGFTPTRWCRAACW